MLTQLCYNLSMATKKQTKPVGSKVKDTRSKVEEMLEEGITQQDIAKKLNLTKQTVNYHATQIKMNKISQINKIREDSSLEIPKSDKILTETDINAVKMGKVKVLNKYLESKVPMLKNLKQKMQHYEALRPVEVTMKRMKVNELIDLGTQVIEDELKAHQSQEKTLSSRDISGLLGTLNNIAALVERQSERVTPQTIQDMPEHMMYANAEHNIIDVKSNSDPLI